MNEIFSARFTESLAFVKAFSPCKYLALVLLPPIPPLKDLIRIKICRIAVSYLNETYVWYKPLIAEENIQGEKIGSRGRKEGVWGRGEQGKRERGNKQKYGVRGHKKVREKTYLHLWRKGNLESGLFQPISIGFNQFKSGRHDV